MFNRALVDCRNKYAKFLTMLFVFLCIGLLFFCFLDGTNDGLAYLFRQYTNPGLRCESEEVIFVTSKTGGSYFKMN